MSFKSLNLQTYFVTFITAFIILFTTVIGFIVQAQSSKSVQYEISEALSDTSYLVADKLDHFMWSRYGEMKVLSTLKVMKEANDLEEITNILNEVKDNFHAYSWIGFTNAAGIVEASTDDIQLGVDISERPVFQNAQSNTYIGDVHQAMLLEKILGNASNKPLQFVDISTPILDENGQFKGVIAAHFSWEWAEEVQNSIIEPIKQKEKNLEVLIIKKDSTVLLGPKDMVGNPLHLEAVSHANKGENSWTIETWPDKQKYLTAYALADGHLEYPGLDWTVLVRQPENIAFANLYDLREKLIGLSILSIIFFGFLGSFLAEFISNPLAELATAANKLRTGKRVEIPVKKGVRDIEILAKSFQDLLSTLTKTESNLDRWEFIAQRDKLTGLRNRLALDYYLENLFNNSKDKKVHAFFYLDLDGFKNVNDTLGHHHGDLLLKVVAQRLNNNIRNSEFICRIGGDEFAIILPLGKNNQVADMESVGKRIITSLNKPIHLDGTIIKIGCSIGTALWPVHDENPYQVLRYADKALFVSKEHGKNRMTHFSE